VVLVFEAEVKMAEPEAVAYVTMHGAYSQIPEGYGRLYGWIAQHGLRPQGMPHAVYLTDPAQVPEGQAVWELWAPVQPDADDSPRDEAGVGIKHSTKHLVAAATHMGPYETIGETYEPLMRWIVTHGFQIAGPPEEIYLSDPVKVAPSEYVTEVRVPVTRL
jgi:effector-binding domain-containing protein